VNSGSRVDWDKGRCHRVSIRFYLLTEGATFNKFTDIGTEARPPEVTLYKFLHFKLAMAHSQIIMEAAEEVMLCGRGHIGTIFVIQDRVNNFPIGLHRRKTKPVQGISGGG
jgi:hypothetical protein